MEGKPNGQRSTPEPPPATNRTGYFDGGKSTSDIKTMRSFSALMIFFVGNVLPLRTLLTTMRLIPNPVDQNRCAHWRKPRDMMRQG
jgi:hypothetical protein